MPCWIRVRRTKKPLRITRFGKPVAEVVPPSPDTEPGEWIGSMKDTMQILGDIVAPGAFLIRVSYAGVNPIDYKLLDRLTADSTYPFVLGIDFAGVVERVPTGERDFQAGDRIFGMARTAHTPSTPLSHPA